MFLSCSHRQVEMPSNTQKTLTNKNVRASAKNLVPTRRRPTLFAQAGLEVLWIDFDHDLNSCTSDGVTIRRNFRTPLPQFSWDADRDITLEPSFAAYSIASTQGNTIRIKVTVRATTPQMFGRGVSIRAVESDGNQGNVLGEVDPSDKIVLLKEGKAAVAVFPSLNNVRIGDKGVSKNTVVWQWQYKFEGTDAWIDFDRTEHTVYVTLGEPQKPWTQPPPNNLHYEPKNDSQLPWIEVLDLACSWANGAKSFGAAATLITEKIYALGKTPVTYHGVKSYIRYNQIGDYTDTSEVFYCTNFLDLLEGKPTRGPHLNCNDCASIISTFSNILGCDLDQVMLENPDNEGFRLNSSLPMGFNAPNDPELITNFPFHVVAWGGPWQGADAAQGIVFDACVKLDENPADENLDWILPANMQFGERAETPLRLGYLHRLVASGDRQKCVPTQAIRRGLDAPQRPLPPAPMPFISIGTRFTVRTEVRRLKESTVMKEGQAVRKYAPTGREAPGWKLLNKRGKRAVLWISSQETSVKRLSWYWTQADGKSNEALVEITTVECQSSEEAHEVLLQLLREPQAPLVPLRVRDRPGDISFTVSSKSTVLFRRANLVFRVKSIGAVDTPVIEFARNLDTGLSVKQ